MRISGAMTVEFTLNGEKVVVQKDDHLHLSAAEYIREHVHCKSVKVGCAEGGCGACAIEVVQQDVHSGQQSVLALNSCLLPVAALHGAHVITAAGLGSSRSGFHEVQRRLAGFHASQCGFCTPGIAVSTHAALMAAARQQQQQATPDMAAVAAGTACSHEQQQTGHTHTSCSGEGDCISSTGQNGCTNKRSYSSSGIACAPSASELLSALDGNLCRCTGWRPIADAAKSLCSDVDIEDLGLCSISKQQLGPLTSHQQLLPAVLQGPLPCLDQAAQQLQPGSEQQAAQFAAALTCIRPGSVLLPTSLQQLLDAVAAAAAAGVQAHLMGGNTGAGIYKQQWQAAAGSACILVRHVPEMQQLTVQQAGSAAAAGAAGSRGSRLLAGAGVTISQLLGCLKGLAAVEEAAGRQLGARNLQFLCGHISRIAGTLVRNAATLGGHLALVRSQQLESDLLPMLIAAGAELQLAGVDGSTCWMPLEEFASLQNSSSSSSSAITAVRMPLPLGDEGNSAVWSYKLTTHRHHNEHAAVNICCWLTGLQQQDYQLRVAVGTYQHSNGFSRVAWRCSRAAAVEATLLAALLQQDGLLQALGQLPQLLLQDVTPAGRLEQYVRSVAPSLLLKGLSVVLPRHLMQQQQEPEASGYVSRVDAALLAELRAAALAELAGRPLPQAQQHLPIELDSAAPLYWPTEKEGAVLQASGEALYSGDEPLAPNALYAAYATSQRAAGRLLRVDWQPALAVDGVVGWVGPDDIPAGPNVVAAASFTGPQEPLFAWQEVAYAGQPLGLVLASTQRAALAGAAAVQVQYELQQEQQQSERGNMTSAVGSAGSIGKQENSSTVGDSTGAAAPAAATGLTSLAAAVAAGSWYDTSKLPTKAAKGDVDGALAGAMRRLSGQLQLGSQRHLYMEPQTAVATPGEGGSMAVVSSCQGCDQVLWAVARVLALQHNQVHVTCKRVGGGFGGKADRAVFPAAAAAVAAHKFARQVRLVVPGDVDGAMNAGRFPMLLHWEAGLAEQGSLAALKLDITCTGGAYFGGGIVEASSIAYAADSVYDIAAFSVGVRVAHCNLAPRTTVRGPGKASAIIMLEHVMQRLAAAVGSDPASFRQRHMIQLPQEALASSSAAAAADCSGRSEGADAPAGNAVSADAGELPHPKYLPLQGRALSTTLGKPIELCHYTLPYMWQQVAAVYRQRRPAVDAFNSCNRLRKRGLAVVPIRYQLYHFARSGRVQIYADGSVLVSHAGTEMGQGIATKVKQAAAHALGQLLPDPSQRAQLLQHIRVAGGCTELLPHAGLAASSTTSEGATVAVSLACEELVGRIRAQLEADAAAAGGAQAQAPLTWQAAVKAVAPRDALWAPKVVLTAAAIGSFGEGSGFGSGYHSFGAGLAEVELDVTTGERELRAVQLVFDAGRSINPAVDLGQVEGAFMQGVGYVLTEEVLEDASSGQALSSSTWTYKPPGIAELPRDFSVHILRDSPLHVPKLQQLSAKGTGEPPLMLAAAVSCALQDAVAAAWADNGQEGAEQQPVLHLPATTASIKSALPHVLD